MTIAAPERDGREVQLKVSGMTCAGCAATVQRAIESRPGVRSASVSVTDGLARVTGDALDPSTLAQAIRARGYGAEAIDETRSPAALRSEIELHQARHERQWRFRATVALSIWAPLALLHWLAPAGWHAWLVWVMLIGSSVVLVTAGGGFYRSAWTAAMSRTTNLHTRIAIGATSA